MAAEGLWGAGGPPGWELEGWYQDLQEVLAAEPPGSAPTWGAEQVSAGPERARSGGSGAGPPSITGAGARSVPAGSTRPGGLRAGRGSGRGAAGARRVRELTAHNERLRAEIQRLSAEVQRTRAALIDRIVNLRQV
ncbi:DDIT3 protein, partial [Menura novaehollandiae]|nr:DDIT3 protein [Menura novaehollandiae]